ncbi:unnamed protein product, partial [Mesorhabditis spiculigera]
MAAVGNPMARSSTPKKVEVLARNAEKRTYLREIGERVVTLSKDTVYPQFGTPCRGCGHELLAHSAHLLTQDDVIIAKLLALSEMSERVTKRMNWMRLLQCRSWVKRCADLRLRYGKKVPGLDMQTDYSSTASRIAACEFVLERLNFWNPPRPAEFAAKIHHKRGKRQLAALRAFRDVTTKRTRAEAEIIVDQEAAGESRELREANEAREALNQLNRAGFDLMRARHFWWCRIPLLVPVLPICQPVRIFGKRFAVRALSHLKHHLIAEALLKRGPKFARVVADVIDHLRKEPFQRDDTPQEDVEFKYTLRGAKRLEKPLKFYGKWLNGEKTTISGDLEVKNLITAAYQFARQRRIDARKVQQKNGDPLMIDVARADDVFEEELNGDLQFRVIQNRVDVQMQSNILYYLSQLLQLYSVALPKMPREYITRLIYDTRHMNMVIIKPDRGVIGGICFRAFVKQGFSEIVFCAVTADEQVKGYGTHLMNHVKEFHAQSLQIYHLMTYADKLAIGYFSKQGFTTEIPIPQENYKGFIKDYDGATLMACHLHPQIPYTHYAQFCMVERDLIREVAKIVYPNEAEKVTRAGIEHKFKEYVNEPVPLAEIADLENEPEEEIVHRKDAENKIRSIVNKLKNEEESWPFLEPVDPVQVPDYYSFITQPIDMQTIQERLKNKYYTHEILFLADLRRLFDNCFRFNGIDTEYYRLGYVLNKEALSLVEAAFPTLKDWFPTLPDTKPTLHVDTDDGDSSEEE